MAKKTPERTRRSSWKKTINDDGDDDVRTRRRMVIKWLTRRNTKTLRREKRQLC